MTEGEQPIIARGKSLLGQLLRSAQTRLELLSIELEQEKLRIGRQLRLAAICIGCLWLAGFTLILWVTFAFSPAARLIVLAVLFALFLIGALISWLTLRRSVKHERLFSRLIGQLRLDRSSLGQEP
jgi:uncharacterized membrane protein YqjE